MLDPEAFPPPAFAFSVALGPGFPAVDASFLEISGLDPRIETDEFAEGGVNAFVHYLPGPTKHSNLVLKRGFVVADSGLAKWAAATVGSVYSTPIQPGTLSVCLVGSDGQPIVTWSLENAWPVKWEVGGFDALKNEVLTETMEFAYATATRGATGMPAQSSSRA